MSDAASFVYIIGSPRPRSPVKIGYSTSPEQRLDDLRTAHHVDLFILAHGPGGRVEKRALHRMFANERMRGEWFRRSPASAT
jgi:T5orf172 domain